ncbi:hypothetical protein BKA82DRAFT_631262 [Pisolithus tinctorius]|uniref:Uncharacterized protein n=1 Tax=Pisolithus tinctorius Marx 270 TaxID=870435 RepID=A0A0C3P6N8_PISTI|nr:hypothetical protein BKA82DRAFT_631262 [Pisolithus tinctorius]KIO03039.1 hypothetical protein M404DRAFT_631262 [Pisolithus tinctorius Marx 270]
MVAPLAPSLAFGFLGISLERRVCTYSSQLSRRLDCQVLLPEYGFREAGRGLPSGHQHRPDHVCRVIQVQSGPRPRGRRSRALAVPCCPAIHAATSLRRYYGRFTRTTALLLRRIVGSRLPASGNFSQRCNTAPLADTPQ